MSAPRLHLDQRLAEALTVIVEGDRAHYLRNVLRLREGSEVRPFNARDGEWSAHIVAAARHRVNLRVGHRLRAPADEPGPALAFAPIRRNRLDWLVEKAVELGAGRLIPVLTARTVVRPEHAQRLRAIAEEAAEQCERLSVPPIEEPEPLDRWLAGRAGPLLVADERRDGMPIGDAWRAHPDAMLLIGPEGGFTDAERVALAAADAVPVEMGRRILRAETAVLFGLAAWQLFAAGDVTQRLALAPPEADT